MNDDLKNRLMTQAPNVLRAEERMNQMLGNLSDFNILRGASSLEFAKQRVREFAKAFDELTELDFYRDLYARDGGIDNLKRGQMRGPRYLKVPEAEGMRHLLELQIKAQCKWYERVELGTGPSGYYWLVLTNDHNEGNVKKYRVPVLMDKFYFQTGEELIQHRSQYGVREGDLFDVMKKSSPTWIQQLELRQKAERTPKKVFEGYIEIVELSGADAQVYRLDVVIPYKKLKEDTTAVPLFEAWIVKLLKDLHTIYPDRQYDYASLDVY